MRPRRRWRPRHKSVLPALLWRPDITDQRHARVSRRAVLICAQSWPTLRNNLQRILTHVEHWPVRQRAGKRSDRRRYIEHHPTLALSRSCLVVRDCQTTWRVQKHGRALNTGRHRPARLSRTSQPQRARRVCCEARRLAQDRGDAAAQTAKIPQANSHGSLCAGLHRLHVRVAAFARRWRREQHEQAKTTGRGTFVPLRFAAGEAFQFDCSEDGPVIHGERTKLQVAQLKLSHSRPFFMRAYLLQTHEMLFDAHHHAFVAWGGIPRRGIYDNMRTAVDRVRPGKVREANARFSSMVSHYLFDAELFKVTSGWEKGQIEKNVRTAVTGSGKRCRHWVHSPRSTTGWPISACCYGSRHVTRNRTRRYGMHGRPSGHT